ncbi:MAG: thioesterase family protein [Yoonia sp.]|uniref:thioesterase family protein n=1 Tax=Yoonia sp. TaxID=2212373 RepID=UPI00273D8CEC|nr:thioesterase family protein [Yoonia sp.]MDP5085515.1 thioesterase family protein [Yoonia sp.]
MLITETFLYDWTGDIPTPLQLVDNTVKPEWVDEYQHLNMAHYLTICDQANWAFWNWINAPEQTIAARAGHEYVIVENHVTYSGELTEGAAFTIQTQLTDFDSKRLILFHRVLDGDGNLSATNEVKCLGFNLETRRPENWRPRVSGRLEQIHGAHARLGMPEQSGQGIALKKK